MNKTIKWLLIVVLFAGSIVAASVLYNQLSEEHAGNNLEIYGSDIVGGPGMDGNDSHLQINTRPNANPNTSSVTTSDSEGTSASSHTETSAGTTVSTSESTSVSTSESTSASTSESTSASTSESTSASTSESTSASTSESTSASTSESTSESTSASTSESTSASTSESTSASTSESTGNDEEDDRYKAPDFTVLDANGNTVKLSDFRGKPVVLNFWATWCYYCKTEMPDFNKAYQKYPDVQFLMVNATDGVHETVSSAKKYVANEGFDFDVFFDTEENAVNAYNITGFPSTFFIDANGKLVARAIGMIDLETLETGIGMIR